MCLFFCFFYCLSVYLFVNWIILKCHRKISLKFTLDLAWFDWDIVDSQNCLFVRLFESSWNTQRNCPPKFLEYLTWFGWDIVNSQNCFFVCLKILGYPQEFFLKLVKIWLDLAETVHSWDCLFVWIILGYPQEVFLNVWRIWLDLAEIFSIYKIICLFFVCACLIGCLFVCLFRSSWDTHI